VSAADSITDVMNAGLVPGKGHEAIALQRNEFNALANPQDGPLYHPTAGKLPASNTCFELIFETGSADRCLAVIRPAATLRMPYRGHYGTHNAALKNATRL